MAVQATRTLMDPMTVKMKCFVWNRFIGMSPSEELWRADFILV